MLKRMKLHFALILLLSLFSSFFGASALAATVGQQLTSPEAGWKRLDDASPNIQYTGTWTAPANNAGLYLGAEHQSNVIDSKVKFTFTGTKLRIIAAKTNLCATNVSIKVDNIEQFYNNYSSASLILQVLLFEKTGLSNSEHTVEITNLGTNYITLDAIDIDDTGSLNAPNGPTNLVATSDSAKVNLTWDPVTDATGYNVKRATTVGGPYTTIASSVTSVTYTDTTVSNGITYFYVITAVSANGESVNSNEASATPQAPLPSVPNAPTNLIGQSGNAQNTLTWTASANATSYYVKRSTTAGGPYTTVASNVYSISYTDTTVTNGITYYYVVTAVNAGGESGNSNEASATPQAGTVSGNNRALLVITLNTGLEKEYDLSMDEVNAFINWYEAKQAGTGTASYAIDKHDNNIGPFKSRKDYIIFDKILTYEVNEYTVTP